MKEWIFDASIESIPAVTALVDEELEALDCPMKAQAQLDIAIDELFSNIAYYAYAPGETGKVTVRFEAESTPRAVTLSFLDSGTPYDPLSAEEPDTSVPAQQRRVGGLGIFLVKKTMDEMRYEYREGKNMLSIRKLL